MTFKENKVLGSFYKFPPLWTCSRALGLVGREEGKGLSHDRPQRPQQRQNPRSPQGGCLDASAPAAKAAAAALHAELRFHSAKRLLHSQILPAKALGNISLRFASWHVGRGLSGRTPASPTATDDGAQPGLSRGPPIPPPPPRWRGDRGTQAKFRGASFMSEHRQKHLGELIIE